jgi:hypothetical protein
MLPLGAALAYSLVQIMTRKMGEAEKASTMVFYIQLNLVFFSSLMGLIFGDGNLADPSQPIIFLSISGLDSTNLAGLDDHVWDRDV